jgi:FAM91 N-terminus
MRVAPFHYYRDILSDAMVGDLAYDAIPNFTAADIVRLMGIGRNEYIAIMVQVLPQV